MKPPSCNQNLWRCLYTSGMSHRTTLKIGEQWECVSPPVLWTCETLHPVIRVVNISNVPNFSLSAWCVPALTHHFDNLGVGLLCQVAPADGHVVHQLVERGALVLLHLEVRQSVHKVKDSTALLQLLQEQLRLLRCGHVWAHKTNRHQTEEMKKKMKRKVRNKPEAHSSQTAATQNQRQRKTAAEILLVWVQLSRYLLFVIIWNVFNFSCNLFWF